MWRILLQYIHILSSKRGILLINRNDSNQLELNGLKTTINFRPGVIITKYDYQSNYFIILLFFYCTWFSYRIILFFACLWLMSYDLARICFAWQWSVKTIPTVPLYTRDWLSRSWFANRAKYRATIAIAYLWRRNVPRPRRALTYPPIITL